MSGGYVVVVMHPDGGIDSWTQAKKPDLKSLQHLVRGYVETVPHFTRYGAHRHATAYCNEEGKLHGLPFNEKATKAWLDCLGSGPFSYEPRLHGDVVIYAKA